jgi:RimJ/RimL family protein N-acetyltransferase
VSRISAAWWPLFDLRIRTPRLELRLPTDDDLEDVVTLVAGGLHPPDEMPFKNPWSLEDPPDLQRHALQHHWRARADLTPESWKLPFCVFEDGRMIGQQDIDADGFAIRRVVSTGSWLGRDHQGRGAGKEMRAAVLHLAFAGLGAERAETAAFADNPASIRVTEALGYEPNGEAIHERTGRPARLLRYALSRERWAIRRRDDIEVTGLAPCLPLLGVPS